MGSKAKPKKDFRDYQSETYNSLLMMQKGGSYKKRDEKYHEHSWSIMSALNDTYQNQSLIDQSEG